MKLFILTMVLTVAFASLAHARRMDARQKRQTTRIQRGVANGSLTKREARGLAREQQKVNKMENRAEKNGEVTAREKARIEQAQDKTNKHIYNQKHDGQNQN